MRKYGHVHIRPVPPVPVDPDEVVFDSCTYSVQRDEGTIVLTINKSGAAEEEVQVSYMTVDGTAVSPTDYEEKSGTLTWAIGNNDAKTVTIDIVDSAEEDELDFSVSLELVSGNAEVTGCTSSEVTITPNPPVCGPFVFVSANFPPEEVLGFTSGKGYRAESVSEDLIEIGEYVSGNPLCQLGELDPEVLCDGVGFFIPESLANTTYFIVKLRHADLSVPPQNFFTSLTVQTNTGPQTYTSASAIYNGTTGNWAWVIGSVLNNTFTHGVEYEVSFS